MLFCYDKLVGKIVEKYKTRTRFAKEMNFSKAVLSHKLCGKTAFKPSEIIKISNLLEIAPEKIGEYFFTPKV